MLEKTVCLEENNVHPVFYVLYCSYFPACWKHNGRRRRFGWLATSRLLKNQSIELGRDETSIYSSQWTNTCRKHFHVHLVNKTKQKQKRVTKGELLQRCFLFPPKTNDLRAHSSEDIKHQSCCFSPTWDKKSNARTTIRHDMNFCNCTVRSVS